MNRIEKADEIIRKMLERRSYEIIEDEELDLDIRYILAKNIKKERVLVFFNNSPKLAISEYNYFIDIRNKHNIIHCIFIYDEDITAMAKSVISKQRISEPNKDIELFNLEELQYDIMEHKFQASFIKLSKQENIEFKEKFGVKIPIIKHDDPVARYYNFKKGDIIKVIRKNEISYRIVR